MLVVAGASGHVGSVVAKELLAKKQKVTVIVRDAAKGAPWSKLGATVAVGSLQDEAFLSATLRNADGLFTLLPPDLGASDFYAYQRKMADAIAGAVLAAKVPHVVMLSSVGADLESGTGPIRGLHYLENALRKAGTKLTAIRAGYFQENVGNSLGAAKQAGIYPNFTASADAPVPMVATRDIGLVAAQALMDPPKKSEVIDLHGPSYSARQVAEKVGRALGKPLNVVDVPQSGWVPAMTQAGMSQSIAEIFAEMYAGFASGKIRPKGDRLVEAKTPLDEVIKTLVH